MSHAPSNVPSTSTRSQGKKGGQRGQEVSEKLPDFKQMIVDALAPIRDDLAKIPSRDTFDAMLTEFLDKIEEKIESKVRDGVEVLIPRVIALERRVESLESSMVVLEHLHKKVDENEQYSRRTCLRILNVPLPKNDGKENYENKMKQIMNDMDCGLNPDDIDCTHRIGPKKTGADGTVNQQIIVKFKSFRQRSLFYRNRAKAKDNIKVRLDLTKRRLSILNEAKEFAKSVSSIDFVFCDINCRLAVKLQSGQFIYSESVSDLENKIREL